MSDFLIGSGRRIKIGKTVHLKIMFNGGYGKCSLRDEIKVYLQENDIPYTEDDEEEIMATLICI